jgi:WXG100 family type VII secretion target
MLDGISMGTPVRGVTSLGGSGSGGSGSSGGSNMGQTADMFKMDYDLFKTSVSQEFRKASDDIAKMNQNLKSKYEPLGSGQDWIGVGQTKFKAEMEGQVFKTLQKLQNALSQASTMTGQMEKLVHDAEQEASNILNWTE